MQAVANGFVINQRIIDHILAGWDLRLNGQVPLIERLRLIKTTFAYAVWEATVTGNQQWLRVRVLVFQNKPELHAWFRTGVGLVGDTSPTIKTKVLQVNEHPLTVKTNMLQGRGFGIVYMHVEFSAQTLKETWHQPAGLFFQATPYVPRDATQTGGRWPYMGLTHPQRSIEDWRKDLYSMPGYGGVFMYRDGKLVPESGFPNMVASAYPRSHSIDKGWIQWTNARAPYEDKDATGVIEPDRQHLTVWRVLAQASMQHPMDQGLAMELEMRAHHLLRQIPAKDKGGTYHHVGHHRSQGREQMVLTPFFHALRQQGLNRLGNEIGLREWARLNLNIQSWKDNIKDHGKPWPFWGRAGLRAYNTGEAGIFYWGLKELDEVLESFQVQALQPEIDHMRKAVERFCFDAFRLWENFPEEGWAVPYYINPDGTDSGSPSGSNHFCWQAAVNHKPESNAEAEKKSALLAMGDCIEPRFKE